MKTRRLLILAMASALIASAGSSKLADQQKLCKIDNLTYSPGALIQAKNRKFMKCTPKGKWTRATDKDLGRK